VLSCFPFVISLRDYEWFKAHCSKRADSHPSASSSAIPVHSAQWRAQLHRASIVYEFEQYRHKTVEYRTKIWLAIWMQNAGSAFHGLPPSLRFSFDCNLQLPAGLDGTQSMVERKRPWHTSNLSNAPAVLA
jgi:hypothetical protein